MFAQGNTISPHTEANQLFIVIITVCTFFLFSSSAQTIDHINVGNNYPTPTLKLIEAKNSNGVPVVSITFLDGFEDTMVFHKYNGIDSDEYYDGI